MDVPIIPGVVLPIPDFLLNPEFWLDACVGIPSTVCSVPQALKIWQTKKAKDVSIWFIGLALLGAIFWLAYGVYHWLPGILFWNTVGMSLLGLTFALKIKYGKE